MQFASTTNLDRNRGTWDDDGLFPLLSPKGATALNSSSLGKQWWASPIFFVPRTLGRTWGTRLGFAIDGVNRV
jgi:hypothetical protein